LTNWDGARAGGAVAATPLVSVVIPTCNRAVFLADAIESVLARSYPKVDAPLIFYRYSDEQLSAPHHTAAISIDTVRTLQKLRREDMRLYRRHWVRFQQRFGVACLNAANACAESDKSSAIFHLGRSVAHGVLTTQSLKVAAKILLPDAAVGWHRWFRARTQATRERGRR